MWGSSKEGTRLKTTLSCLIISLCSPPYALGFSAPTKKLAEQKTSGNKQRVKPIPFIATSSTQDHGNAISDFVQSGDNVLELGTQLDQSTERLIDAVGPSGKAVLVDVARTETNSGRTSQGTRNLERYTDGSFEAANFNYVEIEQFSQWKTILDQYEHPFDVFVLDATAMLGNDLELTALTVVQSFVDDMIMRKKVRPRAVIIKSKAIYSLSRRLIHAQRLFDGSAPVDLKSHSGDRLPFIVAGVGVEEYRRTIPHVIKDGDLTLEVGCFSGTTTALVHEAARPRGYCIGVDIGPKIIERARREHPEMKFAVGDGRKTLELLRIKQQAYPERSQDQLDGFDVVYADIGGLSGQDGLLESLALLDSFGYALEPRCIVIKSLCMRRLASSLRSYAQTRQGGRKTKK